MKERGFHLDSALWNRVYESIDTRREDQISAKGKKRRAISQPQHLHPKHESTPTSPQDRLSHLQDAILTEFTGPFPIAKINLFAVYSSCMRIVSLISDRAHDGHEQGRNCLCFLDVVLSAADRYKDNAHRMQPFGCRDLVGICKEAMSTVLGGRALEEFLWKGV